MTECRSAPCLACPYRRDVPSGVWASAEYDKLRGYDNDMPFQPQGVFMCHATPDHYCAGWATVHELKTGGLLSLRLASAHTGGVTIPDETVPLWDSGNQAADHGQADVDDPSPEAIDTIGRLMGKYERLRPLDDDDWEWDDDE